MTKAKPNQMAILLTSFMNRCIIFFKKLGFFNSSFRLLTAKR